MNVLLLLHFLFLVAYDVGNMWLYFRSGVVQQFAKFLFGLGLLFYLQLSFGF